MENIGRLIHQKPTDIITKYLIHTNITPNQVTFLSLCVDLIAILFFAVGGFAGLVIGAILINFAYTLDCVDGAIAKIKNMRSEFGASFDFISDIAVEPPIYFAITLGLYMQFRELWIWALGFFAMYGIFMSHYILRYLDGIATSSKGYTHTTSRNFVLKIIEKISFGRINFKPVKYVYFFGGTNRLIILFGAIFFSITPLGIFNSMCLVLLFLAGIYNFHWISQFLISLRSLKKNAD